jgi:hypothetical protein
MNTTIKQRKGRTIMHDIELVMIWLFSVSMGMFLTMVMTVRAAQPRRHAPHLVHTQEGVLVPVHTRTLGTPRVTRERETTYPPQAA